MVGKKRFFTSFSLNPLPFTRGKMRVQFDVPPQTFTHENTIKLNFPKAFSLSHPTLPFSVSASFEYAAQQQNHSKYVIIVQNIISICILWEKIIFRHRHSMGNRSTFNNKVNYVLQRACWEGKFAFMCENDLEMNFYCAEL